MGGGNHEVVWGVKKDNKQKKGKQMKRIIVFIICVILPVFAANSAQMCAKNTTTTLVLDPSIQGLNYSYDAPTMTWQTMFAYGTVNGTSACITSSFNKTFGQTQAGLTDGEGGATVVGGELTGKHCWCKMTHPAVSLWAFYYSICSVADCASGCAYYCGNYVRSNASMRAGLFGSVAR